MARLAIVVRVRMDLNYIEDANKLTLLLIARGGYGPLRVSSNSFRGSIRGISEDIL